MTKNSFIVLLIILVAVVGIVVIKQEWPNIFYSKENSSVLEDNMSPDTNTIDKMVDNNQESSIKSDDSVPNDGIDANIESEKKDETNIETTNEIHDETSSVVVNKNFFDASKYTIDANRSSDPVYNNGFIMPDIYNTGYTSRFEDLVDFDKKYPGVGCTITASNAAKYNYTFEGFKSNCSFTINAVDNITFRNFYINSDSWYAINIVAYNGNKYPENTLITDGEIVGSKSASINGSNVTIRRLYIHDYNGDAMKMGSNQVIEGNYIGSGGLGDGAHADGIQLYTGANNVIVRGNRFDMIALNNPSYKANANLFLVLEKDTADSIKVTNNWLNGGGYTTYIGHKNNVPITNLTYAYNKLGNGYKFGYLNHDKSIGVNGINTQLYMNDLGVPSIGSIIYYNNGNRITSLRNVGNNLKILVKGAKYTSRDLDVTVVAFVYNEKNELIETYEQKNTIHKNYTGKEAENIGNLKLSNFPFNVSTILNINNLPNLSNGSYIVTKVYSGQYEIRSDTIRK